MVEPISRIGPRHHYFIGGTDPSRRTVSEINDRETIRAGASHPIVGRSHNPHLVIAFLLSACFKLCCFNFILLILLSNKGSGL
jgi:hypothetical protein